MNCPYLLTLLVLCVIVARPKVKYRNRGDIIGATFQCYTAERIFVAQYNTKRLNVFDRVAPIIYIAWSTNKADNYPSKTP
jgi:hypothetical protein